MCITALALSVAILALDIVLYSYQSDPDPAGAAIVLGAAMWDGAPSPVFEERIRHAIDLYQTGRVRLIIFTGGVGENDRLAESQVAKAYAIRAGVPEEAILIETQSRITEENLRGARTLLAAFNPQRVLVVSDPLHMRRSVQIAHDLGLDAHPSPTPTTRYTGLLSKLDFLVRETYFYGQYWLRKVFIPIREE